MKKALSLTLALVLCLALGVPALATSYYGYSALYGEYPYDPYFYDGKYEEINSQAPANDAGDPYAIAPLPDGSSPLQGVVPESKTDAHINIYPDIELYQDFYYTVNEGDTLAAIAFAFYGDSSLSGALYTANENGHFLYTKGVLEAYRALRIPGILNGTLRLDLKYTNYRNPITPYYPVVTRNTRLHAGTVDDVVGGVAKTYAPWNIDGGYVQPAARDNQIIYICKEGDTLKAIADTWYRNDAAPIVNAIKNANPQLKGDTLTAGFYIILPVITIGY